LSKLGRLLRRDLVLFQPSLPLAVLRGPGAPSARVFPLAGQRTILTYSGTAAVAQAAAALELGAGDAILCPAYACGHELEPLLRAGIPLEFYRVDARMQIDASDLRRRLRPPIRAVLVTHYFGFPQPLSSLRKLCDEQGVYLIEDCAHAFLSSDGERPLGATGDVAVFSMRKTLPLPNGGAAVLNRGDLEPRGALRAPSRLSTYAKTLDLWRKSLLRPGSSADFARGRAALLAVAPLLAARLLLQRLGVPSALDWYDPDDERFDFDSRLLDWAMSATARALLEQTDFAPVKQRRRRNYQRLAEILGPAATEHCPLLPLPDGVCPLYFPLLHDERDALCRALFRQGISAAPWWETFHPAVPWSAFPEARALKDRAFVLPIHQDLDDASIERMGHAALALLRGT
jgi:perosamine synthetase